MSDETAGDGNGSDAETTDADAEEADGPSFLSRNAEFLKATISVYAAVGLGLGLSLILLAEVGSLPISYSSSNPAVSAGLPPSSDAHATATDSLSVGQLYLLPLVIVGIATLTAFDAEDEFDDPKEGANVAAIGSALGAVLLTLVAAFLFSVQMPGDLGSFGPGMQAGSIISLSMNWGNVVIDGILYGIAAGVTAGLVAFARTRFR